MNILKNVSLRDELLTPIPAGKQLVLGTVWDGSGAPLVDTALDAVEQLTRGFITGHVVGAEPAPATLDLGRRYLGDLQRQLTEDIGRFRRLGADEAAGVDVREVLTAVGHLNEQLGAPSPDCAAIRDSVRRLRRAADTARVHASIAHTRMGDARNRTGGDAAQDALSRANAASRSAVERMNSGAQALWGERAPAATTDSTTGMRDAVDAANKATDMRTLIRSKNEANAAFWADLPRR